MSTKSANQAVAQVAQAKSRPAEGLLQRKCACGQHTIGGASCKRCAEERGTPTLQRTAMTAIDLSDAPQIIDGALPSTSQASPLTTRSVKERGFQHDFSLVQMRSDNGAAQARPSGGLAGETSMESSYASPDGTPASAQAADKTPEQLIPGCSCCVETLAIQNASSIMGGGRYGHKFDLVAGLDHQQTNKKGFQDCILKWEEKSSRPSIWQAQNHKMKPNIWYDGFARVPTSPTFDGWTKKRNKPCPGKETATITDDPSISVNAEARTLQFRLTVKSSSGCESPTQSLTVTARQVLEPDIKGVMQTRSFKTPDE